MKKLILTLVIIATFAISVNATIWTVSNMPDSPGQYTSLQAAIDTAANGDTIYVSGSTNSYGNIIINKEIHLFGAGYNPDKQEAMPSTLFAINLAEIDSTDASYSSIQGFSLNNIQIGPFSGTALSNIIIRRNSIGAFINSQSTHNLQIVNNIIGQVQIGGPQTSGLVISNNVFLDGWPLDPEWNQCNTVLISNNLFISSIASGISGSDLEQALFSNNIFYGVPIHSNGEFRYCTWNNNISYGSASTTFPVTGSNSGANNLEAVDPMFVLAVDYNFDYTDDYHLQAGSPGINAGTDGADIGIYGGPYPFPDGGVSGGGYQTSQETPIPQIYEMNGQNSLIPLNGTFQVAVKAHIQQ